MTVKETFVQADIVDEASIERVINRGGSVAADSKPIPDEKEVRFTLRIPGAFMQKIDELRRAKNWQGISESDDCRAIGEGT